MTGIARRLGPLAVGVLLGLLAAWSIGTAGTLWSVRDAAQGFEPGLARAVDAEVVAHVWLAGLDLDELRWVGGGGEQETALVPATDPRSTVGSGVALLVGGAGVAHADAVRATPLATVATRADRLLDVGMLLGVASMLFLTAGLWKLTAGLGAPRGGLRSGRR